MAGELKIEKAVALSIVTTVAFCAGAFFALKADVSSLKIAAAEADAERKDLLEAVHAQALAGKDSDKAIGIMSSKVDALCAQVGTLVLVPGGSGASVTNHETEGETVCLR